MKICILAESFGFESPPERKAPKRCTQLGQKYLINYRKRFGFKEAEKALVFRQALAKEFAENLFSKRNR